MPLKVLPQQVAPECDRCGLTIEFDGIEMHFDAATATTDLLDYGWKFEANEVVCDECQLKEPDE